MYLCKTQNYCRLLIAKPASHLLLGVQKLTRVHRGESYRQYNLLIYSISRGTCKYLNIQSVSSTQPLYGIPNLAELSYIVGNDGEGVGVWRWKVILSPKSCYYYYTI